jgi:hypothetical protein
LRIGVHLIDVVTCLPLAIHWPQIGVECKRFPRNIALIDKYSAQNISKYLGFNGWTRSVMLCKDALPF